MGTLTTGLSNLNTVIGRFSDFARMPAPRSSDVSPNAIVQQSRDAVSGAARGARSAADCA